MLKKVFILIVFVTMLFSFVQSQDKSNLEQLFEKGYFLETVERDLSGAINVYKAVISLKPQSKALLAKTYFRLAECFRKKFQGAKAETYYKMLVNECSSEEKWLKLSQKRLMKRTKNKSSDSLTKKMINGKISIDFIESPTSDVLNFISNVASINIVKLSNFGKDTVTLRAIKVSVKDALELICKINNYGMILFDNHLLFGKKKDIKMFKERVWPGTLNSIPFWALQLEKKLKNTHMTFEVSQASLHDLLHYISTVAKINIVMDKNVKNVLTSLRMHHAKVLSVLRVLCAKEKISYSYENQVIYITNYEKYKGALSKNTRVRLKITMKYDISPKKEKALLVLTDKFGIVRMLDVGKNMKFVAPGIYQAKFKHPGYFPVVYKKIHIKKGQTFTKVVPMISKPRRLSFDMVDSKTNKLVPARLIKINGKPTSYKDTFKPGVKLRLSIHFKNYRTYRGVITVTPGKGPFVISIPLQRK